MSSFDFNKILASIILGIIIILIIGKVGNNLINLEESPQKETAYKIDIPETSSSIITAAENLESIESITLLFANASLNNGEKIYKKCGACHNYEKNSKAKKGFAIVSDPHTGKLLAIANYPRFNPNKTKKLNINHTKNLAVSMLFEPGSILKPIFIAKALDDKITALHTPHNCEKSGRYQIAHNTYIHDEHPRE